MKKLENKISVVTGAASGMGRSIALLFAAQGGKVVATDIDRKGLDSLEKEIRNAGGDVTTMTADMAKQNEVEKIFDIAVDRYGTVDILVNNAGIMDKMDAVGDVTDELWKRVMDVNVNGPFWATRSAVNIMLKKGSGNIINISSIGGLRGARAGAAYTTSKHALMGLTKNTAFMYAKKGIRCNAIAPGGVATNMAKDIDMEKLPKLATEQILPGMATNPRYGEANEIATAALFLASDDASFVNGAILVADGGWIAQ